MKMITRGEYAQCAEKTNQELKSGFPAYAYNTWRPGCFETVYARGMSVEEKQRATGRLQVALERNSDVVYAFAIAPKLAPEEKRAHEAMTRKDRERFTHSLIREAVGTNDEATKKALVVAMMEGNGFQCAMERIGARLHERRERERIGNALKHSAQDTGPKLGGEPRDPRLGDGCCGHAGPRLGEIIGKK